MKKIDVGFTVCGIVVVAWVVLLVFSIRYTNEQAKRESCWECHLQDKNASVPTYKCDYCKDEK